MDISSHRRLSLCVDETGWRVVRDTRPDDYILNELKPTLPQSYLAAVEIGLTRIIEGLMAGGMDSGQFAVTIQIAHQRYVDQIRGKDIEPERKKQISRIWKGIKCFGAWKAKLLTKTHQKSTVAHASSPGTVHRAAGSAAVQSAFL